ncbi:efflux RND transporter periplasmic adaptor subunit [Teredinibacter turnerae]|uniref:efflux RND transporter periplasmic adaptor subunit n=1 Tax=Teredinibacter turnerae TaxID=2426 RepID=UPI00041DCA9A|nr:efflux RND transporter periplasmic adaptor subunit [Teredinibacter turnerae]
MRTLWLLCVVLLATGCGKDTVPDTAVRPVRTITVRLSDNADTRILSGQIQAHRELELSFRVGGELKTRFADVGDVKIAGQPIAELDGAVQKDAQRSAQAALDSALAVRDQVEKNEARLRDLLRENAVSKSAYDNALRELRTAQEQVTSARAQLDSATSHLAYTRLNAPIDGVITRKWAEPGEVVAAGQPIVSLAGSHDWDLLLDVPAELLRQGLATGQQLRVWLAGAPDVATTATIHEVSPLADTVTLTHPVRARLDQRPRGLLLGSTVMAEIHLQPRPGFVVPAAALSSKADHPAVWVLDRQTMKVQRRTVETARYNKNSVLISRGLADGELVVTAGVQLLHEGQQVRLLGAD